MRRLLILMILGTLGAASSAEVVRCADGAGKVSYTDGACPAGARTVGRVAISEAPTPSPDGIEQRQQAAAEKQDARTSPPLRRSDAAVTGHAPAPAGPAIIDSRGAGATAADTDSRWSDRGGDPAVAEFGYPYPGVYAPPRPPRDMRPRIRHCDAAGCQDTQGNHYNQQGQLARYRSIDGKTCQPVGTTTICR